MRLTPLKAFLFVVIVILVGGALFYLLDNKQNKQDAQEEAHSNTLANPASQNCTDQGGTVSIMTRGDGGQFGLCQFADDQACEEWALYRGECPVGGIKTTGFDTIDQKYCAWLGGQTLAENDATCTLPNGAVCKDKELYNGTCPTT